MEDQVKSLTEPKMYRSLDGQIMASDTLIWGSVPRTTEGVPTKGEVLNLLSSLEFKEVTYLEVDPDTKARYEALPKTIEVLGEVLTLDEIEVNTDMFLYYGHAPFHVEVQLSCVDAWSVALDLDQEHGVPEGADSFEDLEPCLLRIMKERRSVLDSYIARAE